MPGFAKRPDDAQTMHDIYRQAQIERNQRVEKSETRTFIVAGAFAAGLTIPPLFVAEHVSMSGAVGKLGAGTATIVINAHADGSFTQAVDLDNTLKQWWEQGWAVQLDPGEPVWLTVSAAAGAVDLSLGVVFGGTASH